MCSIFLTSFPSPVLQPLTNTNLRILQPNASAVDLGHRNHQGSDGFGYLFFLVCLLPVYSNIPRCTICLEVCYQRKGLQWKHRVWQKMQARRVANTLCSCLLINNGSYLSFSFCRSSISPNTDTLATPWSLHPTAVLPLEESFRPFSRPLGEPDPSTRPPGSCL